MKGSRRQAASERPQRRDVLRIGAFVLLLAGAALGLSLLIGQETAMRGLQSGLARVTSGILNLFGAHTLVSGNTIHSSRFSLSVVTACTGLFTTGVFIVAVLAFPARLRAKAIGVAFGVGAIFILNLLRLVSLFLIGVHAPAIFDRVHLLIWQSLLILVALLLWLGWARTVTHGAHEA
jgi:exosortase H (IPTLxxWG-CTERM-specific)